MSAPEMNRQDDDWNGTRGDRLISRIVDRRAEPQDWSGFADLARAEPAQWERLLSSLRTDGALRTALDGALASADRVELPLPSLPRWRQWTGWAAAGLLALCWAGSSGLGLPSRAPISTPPARPVASSPVNGGSPASPTAAGGTAPVAAGTVDPVVEQLPLRLMDARPGPSGRGVEVLYVRPVVERAVVDGVYSFGTDELGRPAPVKVDPATLVASNQL